MFRKIENDENLEKESTFVLNRLFVRSRQIMFFCIWESENFIIFKSTWIFLSYWLAYFKFIAFLILSTKEN